MVMMGNLKEIRWSLRGYDFKIEMSGSAIFTAKFDLLDEQFK